MVVSALTQLLRPRVSFYYSRWFPGRWLRITASLSLFLGFSLTSQTQAAAVAWQRDWRTASRLAARHQRPLLVMVSASWCGPCHRMLEQSFPDPRVASRVNSQFIPLVIDADEETNLIRQWQIDATPTILILDPQRRILDRHTGFETAAELDARLSVIRWRGSRQIALSSRPPIDALSWQRSRHLWNSFTPASGAPLFRRVTDSSHSQGRLTDAFPSLKHCDTLAAAKGFGMHREALGQGGNAYAAQSTPGTSRSIR